MRTASEQIDHLVALGYPALGYLALASRSEEAFRALLEPLVDEAERLGSMDPAANRTANGDERPGWTPYVVVVTRTLVDPHATVPLLRLQGARGLGSKPGVVDRNHGEGDLATYHPLDELGIPDAPAYLLVDIERGEEFCGVAPEAALPVIRGRGRTPLTIDEGIALVTLAPHLLARNACFMLSGSRRDDRRVPALWISQGVPKLGWCWDGNPHSWLGVASARTP